MILLTVGTEKFSFHRLVEAFDALAAPGGPLAGRERFAQIGSSSHVPRHVPHERLVPFERMRALIAGAELVISHAGAGSTLLCLELGQRPLLVPRQRRHGEHVDDHQVGFAERLTQAGRVGLLRDPAELGAAIEAALAAARGQRSGPRAVELAAYLEGRFGALERER